jgi:hypothetical protein
VRIGANAGGALESRALGLRPRLEGTELVMHDARTGERLQTEAESEASAREAETSAREAVEARAQAAELELDRLRRKLDEQ